MQMQDIDVIFLILLLVSLTKILKFWHQYHPQLKTISNITYPTFTDSSYLQEKQLLELSLTIVRT